MNYLQEFLKKHPIYEKITFYSVSNPVETHLHPILPASQAVIDSMLEAGQNRIAIVFPDDDINVLPLIASKYLSNIQELPGFAHIHDSNMQFLSAAQEDDCLMPV